MTLCALCDVELYTCIASIKFLQVSMNYNMEPHSASCDPVSLFPVGTHAGSLHILVLCGEE